MAIKAIETKWKGYRFRSRLEARWAVYFETFGCKWDYEPEGFNLGALGWYLPDFFIHGNAHRGPYVEIKATAPTTDEVSKLVAVCDGKGAYGAMVWGVPGDERWISIHKDGFRDANEMWNPLHSILHPYRDGLDATAHAKLAIHAARSARFEHGEAPA